MENLSYEEAYEQLETVITQLESGELSLKKSVSLYEQGRLLSAHCQSLLENAELKIQQIDDAGTLI